MIYKESRFSGSTELGPSVLPLFNRGTDQYFEKVASPYILPEVLSFIATVRPENKTCFTLVNALGSGEFYSSNSNADYFNESGLIHRPNEWSGDPALDSLKGAAWGYGFPTFYGAHVFPHHRNRDPQKSIGDVVFAAWNPRMHRVELVTKVTEDRCGAQGVTSIWDNLRNLVYADVSMGARVPGDLCSVHADWEELRKAQATYNPRVHANEGVAVAEYHKRRPIRGWARTRKEYCEDMLKRPNAILADGRKVFVYNHYPKFFDISYVFVGADRTAKAMIHVASPATLSTPSEKFRKGWSAVFEDAGAQKTASASKHGTIYKSNIPSNQVPAVVRNISNKEMDLPDDLLSEIGSHDTPAALSTLSSLGIVLKPSEFQRVVLVHRGHSDLADRLSKRNLVFERGAAEHPMALPDQFIPRLVELLRPFIRRRSALHEPLEIRIAVGLGSPDPGPQNFGLAPSALFPELAKMGSRYAEYREAVLPHLSYTPHVLQSAAEGSSDLRKLAQSSVENLFSSLTVEYLRSAFRE